jgi:hypothetical protein
MDEEHLRRKIKRNVEWCVGLAEDIVKERRILDTEFADLVKLIQQESHFLLNNQLAKQRHEELLELLKSKIS